MAIFYTDSGSFNDLKITGSVLVSGSLVVTGSTFIRGLGTTAQTDIVTINTTTGQLFTTASSAIGGGGSSTPTSFIATGSVTASVNVTTSSIFQITSGSSTIASVNNSGSWTFEGFFGQFPTLTTTTGQSLRVIAGGVLILGNNSNNSVILNTNQVNRWIVGGDGHFYPNATNTYDIGTTVYQVRNIYVSSSIIVTGSTTINDVLVLPFQNPLPSGKPTGSVAISGSGGTFVGMFVYNGTAWTNVKA
jgi:hypothetical protein